MTIDFTLFQEFTTHRLFYHNNIKTLLVEQSGRKLVTTDRKVSSFGNIKYPVFPNQQYGFNGRKFTVTTIVVSDDLIKKIQRVNSKTQYLLYIILKYLYRTKG